MAGLSGARGASPRSGEVQGPALIVALDVPTLAEATRLVERLGDACRYYKVGSELFTREGPVVVEKIRQRGCEVFLDLKFHDIPNTVGRAAASAAALGASLITVHGVGGASMVRAAVEGAGDGCAVLVVTVLTSFDAVALGAAWDRSPIAIEPEVLRFAGIAREAGAHGVVCGGAELAAVRRTYGYALATLVPGVRLAGGEVHDQARAVTPAHAARDGARYLVLGRTVTRAADPAAAFARAVSEAANAPLLD